MSSAISASCSSILPYSGAFLLLAVGVENDVELAADATIVVGAAKARRTTLAAGSGGPSPVEVLGL